MTRRPIICIFVPDPAFYLHQEGLTADKDEKLKRMITVGLINTKL